MSFKIELRKEEWLNICFYYEIGFFAIMFGMIQFNLYYLSLSTTLFICLNQLKFAIFILSINRSFKNEQNPKKKIGDDLQYITGKFKLKIKINYKKCRSSEKLV